MKGKMVTYDEEKTIVKMGNGQGVFLKPKILEVLDIKLGDKVKVRYNFVTMEVIISGVG